MKLLRTAAAALFFTAFAFGTPTMAIAMSAPDVSGDYYAAEMVDTNGTFTTTFLELSADGMNGLTYTPLSPQAEPRLERYRVFEDGMFSLKANAENEESFGAFKGAVSPNGRYLTLGDMVFTGKGGRPSLMLAIKKSSGLDQSAINGAYNLFVFYRALVNDSPVVNTNSGTFTAGAGTLSGQLTETENPFTNAPQPLTGAYEATYTIAPDGRMGLNLTSGQASGVFEEMLGVVSEDGSVFVAAGSGREGANQAFIIGIRQRAEYLTLADLQGSYYVDDFGYYPFDADGLRNDASGYLVDLTFSPDGTLDFTEKDATCQSEGCPLAECPDQICPDIGSTLNGTFEVSPGERRFTYTIADYPEGRKQGGQINLSPDGTVLAMFSPLYLGIGIEATEAGEPGEPVANAGEDQTVAPGETVTLDGSASTDPDGSIVRYKWIVLTGTPALVEAISLSDDTAVRPTFTVPNSGGRIVFNLIVYDDEGNYDDDLVEIQVTGNQAPTAVAGPDQTVDEQTAVTLDGSASSDPDDGIATYAWTQTGEPQVALENAATAEPNFIAPRVDARTELTFELTVEDNSGAAATDTVSIFVNDTDGSGGNQAPVADAGRDKRVCEGDTVILDASGSSDPDGRVAAYAWTQTGGPDVALTDANTARASFTAPPVEEPATLTFQLTVTDESNQSATDTVSVLVDNDGNGNGMPDGMESDDDGDINGDGVFDFDDPRSVRFRHVNGEEFIGFFTSAGTLINVGNVEDTDPSVPQAGRPADLSCPYGVFSYTITGLNPGDSAEVTFVLPQNLPANASFYKIDEPGGWQPVGIERGEAANTFTVTLTDGDRLTDADGEANGQIVDPSTIGVARTGSGSSSDDGCFIRAIFR